MEQHVNLTLPPDPTAPRSARPRPKGEGWCWRRQKSLSETKRSKKKGGSPAYPTLARPLGPVGPERRGAQCEFIRNELASRRGAAWPGARQDRPVLPVPRWAGACVSVRLRGHSFIERGEAGCRVCGCRAVRLWRGSLQCARGRSGERKVKAEAMNGPC